eukprot:gene16325-biopygen4585
MPLQKPLGASHNGSSDDITHTIHLPLRHNSVNIISFRLESEIRVVTAQRAENFRSASEIGGVSCCGQDGVQALQLQCQSGSIRVASAWDVQNGHGTDHRCGSSANRVSALHASSAIVVATVWGGSTVGISKAAKMAEATAAISGGHTALPHWWYQRWPSEQS